MKELKVIGSAILALSVLARLGYLLNLGLQAFVLFLASLDSTFAAALVAASATGFWCRQRRDLAIMGYGASEN